ncbi:MAG: enoyl-CoA hydratase/isomerase family protein [Pseudomonadota bacterium]
MTQIPISPLEDRRGAVRIITINDAPWNLMSFDFMDRLEAMVEEIENDDSTRAVVITGAGDKNFSAGMNLKELMSGVEARGGQFVVLDQRLRVLSKIENMGKPWIATLFGFCLGGGLELPLACHFRIAAEHGAQIGLPEMDLGSVPAWGGSARLSRCVGRDHALDMILRGRKVSGPEAKAIGLVTEVVPNDQLKARALELAEELASMPRLAIKAMMGCIVGHETKTLEESIADERAAIHATFDTPDREEGFRAFVEKRKPEFNKADG